MGLRSRLEALSRLKLERDKYELKLLLAETQSFLHPQPDALPTLTVPPSPTRSPPTSSQTTTGRREPLLRDVGTPAPPPQPPRMPRTSTESVDFHATYVVIASTRDTLRRLAEQVRAELERKAPLTPHDALVKIQRLWKLRSARKQLQALVRSLYTRCEDPATGKTYYYNTKTHTSQWRKPKALSEQDATALASARTTTTFQERERPLRVFQSQEEQRVDAARRIQGLLRAHRARTHMRHLISAVYEKIWDPSSARFYYHNTRTKHVTWERPRWVSDAELRSPRLRRQRTEPLTANDAAAMVQRAYRRKKGFEALLQRCRQVYERIFDASQNAYYYHNTRTKETTWDKPVLLRHALADVLTPRSRRRQLEAATATALTLSPPALKSRKSRAWTEESAAACLQTLFRSRQARRALDERLAQVYRRALDPDSGCFYYVDTRTDGVSWDVPTLLQRRSTVEVGEFH